MPSIHPKCAEDSGTCYNTLCSKCISACNGWVLMVLIKALLPRCVRIIKQAEHSVDFLTLWLLYG